MLDTEIDVEREASYQELLAISDIDACIDQICTLYEIDHVAYHLGYKNVEGVDDPYVRTNYSSEWVGRYVLKNYIKTDPVAVAAYESSRPVSWAELDWSSPQAQEFMVDARAHGVGQSGLLVPIIDRHQRRAMVNFSAIVDPEVWHLKLSTIEEDLIRCADILHSKALEELYPEGENLPKLSPREREVLKIAAEGLEASEIARVLGLSEHTVRDYLKSARAKLGCSNIAQAIHKATVSRLI